MARLSRILVIAVLAALGAACGGAAQSGTAWPKSAGSMVPDDWKDDGGESLAPRVAIEISEAKEPEEVDEEAEAEAVDEADDADEKPAATPAKTDQPSVEIPADEIFLEEEIIIEVE